MVLSGLSPDGELVEMVELPGIHGFWAVSSIRNSKATHAFPSPVPGIRQGGQGANEIAKEKPSAGRGGRTPLPTPDGVVAPQAIVPLTERQVVMSLSGWKTVADRKRPRHRKGWLRP
jgi:hypothetical protein